MRYADWICFRHLTGGFWLDVLGEGGQLQEVVPHLRYELPSWGY
jgi:hypothetical protein